MKELEFKEEKLKIKKGFLESFLNYPTHEQSIDFGEKVTEAKTTRERTACFIAFIVDLGASQELCKKLSMDEILKIIETLRGDEKN